MPWNCNAPVPCPACDGRGCTQCGWLGSMITEARTRVCECAQCVAPDACPNCGEGLCRECEQHYFALADAAEARDA